MPELARLDFDVQNGVAIANIIGEVDLSNIALVQREVEQHLDDAGRHVVDLSQATYLDSSGIGLLFSLVERYRARGQDLELVVPAASPIVRLLAITDLLNRVTVRERLADVFEGE